LLAAALAPAVLIVGAYTAAVASRAVEALAARRSPAGALLQPLRSAALLLRREPNTTERPDAVLWAVAPAAYAALAAAALAVVPLAEGVAIADVRTGIVLFGAAEALVMVAVFLHGWAPNSHLALLGGYRFVALALSYELLSMFVLIAAALPAESLRVSAIVESQAGLWNVVRQPLGLPLWLIVTLGVTFLGPVNVADGADLASGTSVESSGRQRLAWEAARGGMLTVFSLMGAAVFLGGWHGPLLPGWAWIVVKGLVVMLLVLWLRHHVGRVPTERAVGLLWKVGLPLAFLGLLQAGIVALA
jgi:NADH-quinone oxidoreductase subunit H